MDFKVAGTRDGVTALQMDNKAGGITRDILVQALEQAKRGRLQILDIMDAVISSPREELSQYAPRIYTMNIDPDKIRDVIGPAVRPSGISSKKPGHIYSSNGAIKRLSETNRRRISVSLIGKHQNVWMCQFNARSYGYCASMRCLYPVNVQVVVCHNAHPTGATPTVLSARFISSNTSAMRACNMPW